MKKCKTIIIILMCILMVQVASAKICEDKMEISSNCTMVSPADLDCTTYTYDIMNLSGFAIVDDAPLSSWNADAGIYAFNFSQSKGDYIILLCDTTTREVRVVSEDKMIIAMIILLPMLLGFMFLVGAVSLGKQHTMFKIFLFLLSIPTFFASMNLGLAAINEFYEIPGFIDIMGFHINWIGIMFSIFIIYYLIMFLVWAFHTIAEKKDKDLEY